MITKKYRVADHIFSIVGKSSNDGNILSKGFLPFEWDRGDDEQPLFRLEVERDLVKFGETAILCSFSFEEVDCIFRGGRRGYEFDMFSGDLGRSIVLQMPLGSSTFFSNIQLCRSNSNLFRFLLWMAYGIASVDFKTVAVHSSVVIWDSQAILFLGESGTGKSTHTRLWLENIRGSMLLNDDSPIVRVSGGVPVCYGSPWSGKTSCYINESYPIAAIVRLRQSLFNRIEKLGTIGSFGALYPSCPPSFTHDEKLTDNVCTTISEILKKVPVYMLDCLPEAAAAELVFSTVFKR